ncbi:hypothetical protein PCANC_21430 [Puccinia coronata f. sp. avenae]|uniref:DNA-directed RNA polymerase I subunit RPA49 n=1 Tax=Puccinia coronata f. sp. avenae TaxID=200324 RepID=A0A2N5RZM9_9BASI|nr:hypothetical protein PCANC_21430 [Puccinia coronata f. sp. avenae]
MPDPTSVSILLSAEKAQGSYVGPVLATFPDVQPNLNTNFQLYNHKSNDKAPAILVGETEELEYRSESQAEQPSCTYYIGSYNASAGKLTVFPTQLHQFRPMVKRLREADENRISELPPTNSYAARSALGATFGTKKARRALQAAARSKVDPDTLTHLEGHVTTAITENSTCLPSLDAQAQETDANRPIPPFNVEATDLKDVYLLSNVVSNLELNSIPLGPLLTAVTAQDAARRLPSPHSKYVVRRLEALWKRCPNGKLDKKEIKDSASSLAIDSSSATPDSIIDGILSRFTEAAKGSDGSLVHNLTSFSTIKLYSYIAVLCLIHDEFMTRIWGLPEDLQEAATKHQRDLSELGLQIEQDQRVRICSVKRGPADTDAKEFNAQRTVAKLVIPLVFPPPKLRKRRQKRAV